MRDNLKQFTELEPCLFRTLPSSLPSTASITATITTSVTITTSIRNANTTGAARYPLHFSLKFRETSGVVASMRVSKLGTPAPFVPRNLAKSFTLSTHCRDKACIRSYYLTVYNLASPSTKTGAKQGNKAYHLRVSFQSRECMYGKA